MVEGILKPGSIEELSSMVGEARELRVIGHDSYFDTRPSSKAQILDVSGLNRIVAYEPQDQVLVAAAGAALESLDELVRIDGFWIPGGGFGSLGGSVSIGGSGWRDCVLGMTVVLADGRIVKFGSRAVKNVAGYDGHKLYIGARGTLGVIANVVLRLTPGVRKDCSEPFQNRMAEIIDPTSIEFMRRAKDLFDPTHKLNPGDMGIF